MPQSALIERLELGDHVCWTFEDDQARDRVLAGYVRGAIREHHKVVYFPYTRTPEQAAADLAGADIDVEALRGAGQFEVHSARDAYLGSGDFDPAAMVASCLLACEQARAAGYAGLRLAGEMTWAAEPQAPADQLARYEAEVNRVYAHGYSIGLCLYDGRRFPRDRVSAVLAVHPAAVDGGTAPDWSPLLRIRYLDRAIGLRLDGATDLSNRGSLVALLDTLAGSGPEGSRVLDVTALSFADLPTAHAIVVAAARLGGLRVLGASAALARLLTFVGADRVPGLVVERAETLRTPA